MYNSQIFLHTDSQEHVHLYFTKVTQWKKAKSSPFITQRTGMLATARHQSGPWWLKAVNWFDESHSGEMGSMYTNHMWRFQGPDKLTSLLIICVSRERNVIHRHLQGEFLPWHSCDLFGFRHDVLEKKRALL